MNLDNYLHLNWSFTIEPSDDDQEPWTARVQELPGCMSHGVTVEEALHGLKEEALPSWIEAAMEAGNPIPEPINREQFKGTLTYRTSPETHYQLVRKAQQVGLSINKLIDKAVEQVLKGQIA